MLNISGIYYLLLNLECAVLEKTETLFIGLVNPLTQVSVYGTGICSDCYFSLVALKKKKKNTMERTGNMQRLHWHNRDKKRET